MSRNVKALCLVALIGALTIGFLVGMAEDKAKNDTAWRKAAFNREMDGCLQRWNSIAKVYDYNKLKNVSDERLAQIIGTKVEYVRACRY